MTRFVPCLSLLTLLLLAPAMADGPPYQVEKRLAIGGNGGWDYPSVDPTSHMLYLSRGDHVAVIDPAAGTEITEIPGTPGVHGIAVSPQLNRGWISSGKADQVKVFDLKTRAPLTVVPTGANPDAIVYEPLSRRVFAFNGRGRSATVIDAANSQAVATIPLGGKPEFARADRQGRILVNIEDTAELVMLDARAGTVLSRWPLPRCTEPTGLAYDAGHHRAFSTCGNQVLVVTDTDSGKSVASVPIGRGVDGAEFDASTQEIFAANGEGTLTVVHEDAPDRYSVVQTLSTQRGARTIALDGATHQLYLPSADFGPAPQPTPDNPHARPPILDGTFVVLVVGQRR